MDERIKALAKQLLIKNIVLEGGGVKGLAYAGVFIEAEKYGFLQNIERIGGSSVGAIAGMILALGYTPREINGILSKLDIASLRDNGSCITTVAQLTKKFGICEGQKLFNFIQNLIERKTGKKNLTFRELHQLRQAEVERNGFSNYKDLFVTGVNLETRRSEVFSHANNYADFPIALAVRISASIPIFFAAVRVPPGRHGRGGLFVDGALIRQYPVDLFDDYSFLPELVAPQHKVPIINYQTVGIKLDSTEEIYGFFNEPVLHPINGTFDYIEQLLRVIIKPEKDLNARLFPHDKYRTIFCDTGTMNSKNFLLSEVQKQQLIVQGQIGFLSFMRGYANTLLNLQKGIAPKLTTVATQTSFAIAAQKGAEGIPTTIISSDLVPFTPLEQSVPLSYTPSPYPLASTSLSVMLPQSQFPDPPTYIFPTPMLFTDVTSGECPQCSSATSIDHNSRLSLQTFS